MTDKIYCSKKIKVYERHPVSGKGSYKKDPFIEVSCRRYEGHEDRCETVLVDSENNFVGDVTFPLK